MAPSSRRACAACKYHRRKCTQECVFAPHFPREDPRKFLMVHNLFGSSNVARLLNDLPAEIREDAVRSLAYEAFMRLKYPVFGCYGAICVLEQQLRHMENELHNLLKELSAYIEISNSRFSMDGGGGGAQTAHSDHQNPQLSHAAAGASTVRHHHHSLQQQQQQLHLQQPQQLHLQQPQQLHLQQPQQLHLQQQEGQEPALHLKDADDDKDGAGPSS